MFFILSFVIFYLFNHDFIRTNSKKECNETSKAF